MIGFGDLHFAADLDPALSEAARDLGSSPLQAFWLVTVPVIFPAMSGCPSVQVAATVAPVAAQSGAL